jgi:hypothetical protein
MRWGGTPRPGMREPSRGKTSVEQEREQPCAWEGRQLKRRGGWQDSGQTAGTLARITRTRSTTFLPLATASLLSNSSRSIASRRAESDRRTAAGRRERR